MEEYDILIITLVGSVTSIFLLSLKLCFKSKCSDCNLCFGCIKIKRDVKFETELENTKKPQPETVGQAYPSEANLQQLQQGSDSAV